MTTRISPTHTRRRSNSSARTRYRPEVEGLERRRVLSTLNWTGQGDGTSFGQAANWDLNQVPGTSDDAVIRVDYNNTIQIPDGTSVQSIDQTNGTLNIGSGTVTTTTGLRLSNGSFVDHNGTVVGLATMIDSTLNLSASGGPGVFHVGGMSSLNGAIAKNQTVWVDGGLSGNATFTLRLASANMGTIRLESTTTSPDGEAYSSNLAVDVGFTFRNTGTILVNPSATPSILTGSFQNLGMLTVAQGATLRVGSNGATFEQRSGTLDAQGAFSCGAGTFLVSGGSVSGMVSVSNASLRIASTITFPTTVYVAGTAELLGNESSLGTVWVQGGLDHDATLFLKPGSVNLGTIRLESTTSSPEREYYSSNLINDDGFTFINAGTVLVNPSVKPSSLSGRFTNQGTITVAAGATLRVGKDSFFSDNFSSFTQESGTLDAPGYFVCTAGIMQIRGGSVSGNVAISNAAVILASTITLPTTIYVDGSASLISNDTPLGTIWVRGGASHDAELIVSHGSNLGTIRLESIESPDGVAYSSNLTIPRGTGFTNDGTILFNPSPAPSYLIGVFSNNGVVKIAGASLIMKTYPEQSAFFNQKGGTIDASGFLDVSSARFENYGTLNVKGDGAASLEFHGDFRSSGVLNIQVGGKTAGSGFDQLNITGAAHLGGTINISLINGYQPSLNDPYPVMTFASADASFLSYQGLTGPNNRSLLPGLHANDLTFTAHVTPKADLKVETSGTFSPTGSHSATFVVTITNLGPDIAFGTILNDTFTYPTSWTFFATASTNLGSLIRLGNNGYRLTIGSLGSGRSATLTIVLQAFEGGVFSTQANATTWSLDPNPINNASSTKLTLPFSTVISLGSSKTYTTVKQPLSFTVKILTSIGMVKPTGTVTFFDGLNPLQTVKVDASGKAILATSSLGFGTHTIMAKYSGDNMYLPSSETTPVFVKAIPISDYDGDGYTDLAVYGKDVATGRYRFKVLTSSTGFSEERARTYDNNKIGFGNALSIPVPGDYFGDGREAYAVWTPNQYGTMTFTAVSSLTYRGISVYFGGSSDVPVVADVDGDGKADFGVYGYQVGLGYRFSFLLTSRNFNVASPLVFNNKEGFGNAQSVPVVGDYDGDGKADFALYTPSANGSRFVSIPSSGVGRSLDISPIGSRLDTASVADHDGDGKADLVLYGLNPLQAGHYRFLVLTSSSGFAPSKAEFYDNHGYGYGNSQAVSVMADYEGIGRATFALYGVAPTRGMRFVYQTSFRDRGAYVPLATSTPSDIALTSPTYLRAQKVRGI